MRVFRLNSKKEVLLKINKYRINWETSGNSSLERRFRDLIYPFWKNHIVLFQCAIPGSLLKIDFICLNKRLAVETNGSQHNKFNKFFHNNSRANYLKGIKNDIKKQKWLDDNHIDLLELEEADLDLFSPKYIEDKFGINIV